MDGVGPNTPARETRKGEARQEERNGRGEEEERKKETEKGRRRKIMFRPGARPAMAVLAAFFLSPLLLPPSRPFPPFLASASTSAAANTAAAPLCDGGDSSGCSTASALVSLFGGRDQASSIPQTLAQELLSSVRLLTPFPLLLGNGSSVGPCTTAAMAAAAAFDRHVGRKMVGTGMEGQGMGEDEKKQKEKEFPLRMGREEEREMELSPAREENEMEFAAMGTRKEGRERRIGRKEKKKKGFPSADSMQELIARPPKPVAELARKVVEWGGDPTVICMELSDTRYPIPDVENAYEQRCQLTKYTNGRRFINKELNEYMAFLFEAIVALAPNVGFNVSLNRFDLFHGHMFLATNTGRLGILFHAREYPAFDNEVFPINLGYCQVGSNIPFDESMNFRNILWLAPMPDCSESKCSEKWLAPGVLLVLDATPKGIIFRDLVPEYVDVVRTVYEADFGTVVVDVNYLNLVDNRSEDRVFLC